MTAPNLPLTQAESADGPRAGRGDAARATPAGEAATPVQARVAPTTADVEARSDEAVGPAVAPREAANKPDGPVTPASPRRVVVIGNGMVSHRLCERLAPDIRAGRISLVVFGEEPGPAYDRVHLTDMLSGRRKESLELHGLAWYAERGIALRVGDPVVAVDRARRMVLSRSGHEETYDELVFATGAAPAIPRMPGLDDGGVLFYRTMGDLERIAAHAAGRDSAAVVGGGLLGLETARALHNLGLKVTVLEAAPHLMPNQLDEDGAALLREHIESLGIRVEVDQLLEGVEAREGGYALLRGGAPPLTVDLVVVSTGIRPRDKLAAYAGLACGPRGGILIDDRLCTSDPGIYAIGDCAVHAGTTYGLVAPGYRMADVLARRLRGEAALFEGGDRSARLKLMDMDVVAVGDFRAEASAAVVHRAPGVYRKLVLRRGRVVGAVGVGPWSDLGVIQERIHGRRYSWPWQLRRFRRVGRLDDGTARTRLPVVAWPATAVVCHCMGITRGALGQAMARGCASVESLADATGASTACGTCRVELANLVGAPAPPPARTRGLMGAALATSALFLAWLTLPALPYANSVQGTHLLEGLWRSGTARQVTGFAMLGLILVALALSLRKRWKRFRLGSMDLWRLLHGLVGLSALVLLVLHTGLRSGHNLNRALLVDFVAVNGLGAVVGVAFASDGGRRASRAWARSLRFVHASLMWPLAALLGFHILAAYWF